MDINPRCLVFVSEKLRGNHKFMVAAIRKMNTKVSHFIINESMKSQLSKKPASVQQYINKLTTVNYTQEAIFDFILEAITINSQCVVNIDSKSPFFKDEYSILRAISINPQFLGYADKELRENREIPVETVEARNTVRYMDDGF